MTDEEIVRIVTGIFRRAQAGEFGMVGRLRPGVHVRMKPFRVEIGTVLLNAAKAAAVADGRLHIEARALGWVLGGQPETVRAQRPRKVFVKRRPAASQLERRVQYLRETGRA